MNREIILSWLKTTDIPLTTISKKSKISRKTLYNWINGGEVRKNNIERLADTYSDEIVMNSNTGVAQMNNKFRKGKPEMDIVQTQQQTINSQQTTIDLQNQRIKQLETEQTQAWPDDPAKYKLFADIIPDCKSVISLSNVFSFSKPIERCISDMNGFEKVAEGLGMSYETFRDDYFAEGQTFPNDNHPAEQLFSKNSAKDVREYSKGAREILRNLKYKFMGYDYLSFYVDYEYNNRIVKTVAAIRLEYGMKTCIAQAKTTILNQLD